MFLIHQETPASTKTPRIQDQAEIRDSDKALSDTSDRPTTRRAATPNQAKTVGNIPRRAANRQPHSPRLNLGVTKRSTPRQRQVGTRKVRGKFRLQLKAAFSQETNSTGVGSNQRSHRLWGSTPCLKDLTSTLNPSEA